MTFQNFYGSEIVEIYITDYFGSEMYEIYRKKHCFAPVMIELYNKTVNC